MTFWRPLHKEDDNRIISDKLKIILKNYLTHTYRYPLILTWKCVEDLKSIRSQNLDVSDDINKLINAILMFGDIEIGEIL